MSVDPMTYDLPTETGVLRLTVEELTRLAARAKTRVKASARGWSLLSQHEVLALVWLADVMLEDATTSAPPPAQPEPQPISNV